MQNTRNRHSLKNTLIMKVAQDINMLHGMLHFTASYRYLSNL